MKYLLLSLGLCCSLQGFPQLFSPAEYPHGYFRDPLAIPMSLAANFGELRPDHYHMGLDIRTQHRENLPVFAAADGYIARVSIAPFGFGQAIYINHPNGYTTVYGHLNRFFPALAAYVHKEQYRRQSWQVSLDLPPGRFRVKQGDLIAYSGSTGGSQGPHLHFEIRRTAGDVNCNPLLFGLPVPDNTPPTIVKLAWYDRNQGIFEQSPHEERLITETKTRKGGATYSTVFLWNNGVLTVPSNRISFAIQAFDTQSGSANPNGIFEADLYEDNRPVIGFRMDRISYDDTRNVNAHIDYRTRERGGPFFQHLSFLSGYPFPSIYSAATASNPGHFADPASPAAQAEHPENGVLDIGDGRQHQMRIEVRDTYGNTSSLFFTIRYDPGLDHLTGDSAAVSGKWFYPGMVDGMELPGCAFYVGEKSLYDSVIIGATVSGYPAAGNSPLQVVSPSYAIGAPWIPLREPVLVRLQYARAIKPYSSPDSALLSPTDALDRVVMVCNNPGGEAVQRVEWREGWASARFPEFGTFQLVQDTVPPVIASLRPLDGAVLNKVSRIVFSAKDDLGEVRNFRAELDGAWLCFTNDKKRDYIYTMDEHCPPGPHTLKVTVEDVAGNKTVKEYHFTYDASQGRR